MSTEPAKRLRAPAEAKVRCTIPLNSRPLPRDIDHAIALFLTIDDLGALANTSHANQELVCAFIARMEVIGEVYLSKERRKFATRALQLLSGVSSKLRVFNIFFDPVQNPKQEELILSVLDKHQATIERFACEYRLKSSAVLLAVARCPQLTTYIATGLHGAELSEACGLLAQRSRLKELDFDWMNPETATILQVLRSAPLEILNLTSADLAIVRCLASSPSLTKLRKLRILEGGELSHAEWALAFENLPHLTDLYFGPDVLPERASGDVVWKFPSLTNLECWRGVSLFSAPKLSVFEGTLSLPVALSLAHSPIMRLNVESLDSDEDQIVAALSKRLPVFMLESSESDFKAVSILRLVESWPFLRYLSCPVNSADDVPELAAQILARQSDLLLLQLEQGTDDEPPLSPVYERLPGPVFEAKNLLQLKLQLCDDNTLRALRCPNLASLELEGERCLVKSLGNLPAECFPDLQGLRLVDLPQLDVDSTLTFAKSHSALSEFAVVAARERSDCCNSEFVLKLAKLNHQTLHHIVVENVDDHEHKWDGLSDRDGNIAKTSIAVSADAVIALIRNTPKMIVLQLSLATIADEKARDTVLTTFPDRVNTLVIMSYWARWTKAKRNLRGVSRAAHSLVWDHVHDVMRFGSELLCPPKKRPADHDGDDE